MLTDPGDPVLDPFAGSCVTGEVCERLKRKWLCCDNVEEYVAGALGRFHDRQGTLVPGVPENKRPRDAYYRIYHPSALWDGFDEEPLAADGGATRKTAENSATERGNTVQLPTVRNGPSEHAPLPRRQKRAGEELSGMSGKRKEA